MGIVQIDLVHPQLNCLSIEKKFRTELGLRDAVIVPTPPLYTEEALWGTLGAAGATYLRRRLRDGVTLGTAWGATLSEVARRIMGEKLEDFSVVMLLGGLTSVQHAMDPAEIARQIGGAFGGRCYPLCAPAIVDTRRIKDCLLSDTGISSALNIAQAAQVALVGIGSTTDTASVVRAGVVSASQVEELRIRGAVGDICYRYYDADGRAVRTDFDERVVGLSLPQLRKIPEVIAVAGGKTKVKPIAAAIRGGLIDVLVTDESTAGEVLGLFGRRV
jgi:DNA-binding transcriptional regulator LsrR (DeoR family)